MKIILRISTIIAVVLIILSSCTVSVGTRNIKLSVNEDDGVKLDGSILVEINDTYHGAVFPSINLSSDNIVKFNVTRIDQDTYQVNCILKIDVEVLGNFTKSYPLGRYLTTLILILRENGNSDTSSYLYRGRLIDRLSWSIDRFNLVSAGEKYIEIPLQYVTNLTSENATMRIFALGTPTGILAKDKHVFAHKKVNLTFFYNFPYTLTINTEGSGSVIKDPDQITYSYGTDVLLTAVADPGWAFDHWSGDLSGSANPSTITMDGDKTVTANFSCIDTTPPITECFVEEI